MAEIDWKRLLLKYVAQVEAAEGPDFALDARTLAPGAMGDFEFSAPEIAALEDDIFPAVRRRMPPPERDMGVMRS